MQGAYGRKSRCFDYFAFPYENPIKFFPGAIILPTQTRHYHKGNPSKWSATFANDVWFPLKMGFTIHDSWKIPPLLIAGVFYPYKWPKTNGDNWSFFTPPSTPLLRDPGRNVPLLISTLRDSPAVHPFQGFQNAGPFLRDTEPMVNKAPKKRPHLWGRGSWKLGRLTSHYALKVEVEYWCASLVSCLLCHKIFLWECRNDIENPTCHLRSWNWKNQFPATSIQFNSPFSHATSGTISPLKGVMTIFHRYKSWLVRKKTVRHVSESKGVLMVTMVPSFQKISWMESKNNFGLFT